MTPSSRCGSNSVSAARRRAAAPRPRPSARTACPRRSRAGSGTSPARDRAGVERGHRLVDRDAGLLVAREDRALDRRGAAPARQQRRVHVQPERPVEQRLRDEQAVREITIASTGSSGSVRLLGLVHRTPSRSATSFVGGRRELAAAAARRVGPGEEVRDLVARGEPLEQSAPNGAVAATPRRVIQRLAQIVGRSVPSASLRCSASVRSMISTPSRSLRKPCTAACSNGHSNACHSRDSTVRERRTTLQHSIESRAFRSPQRDGLSAGEEGKEGLSILDVTSPLGDGNGHIHMGAQRWWKTTDQRRIGW